MFRLSILLFLSATAGAQTIHQTLQGHVNFSGGHSWGSSSEIFADSFTTFEQGSVGDLLTLQYLTNSTISLDSIGWAYVPVSGGNTTFKRTYIGSNGFALTPSIAIGTAQYGTGGTRAINYDSTTNAVNESAQFILPGGAGGSHSAVSFGMLVQFCTTNSGAGEITNRFVTLNGTPYCSCHQSVSLTLNRIRAYATLDDGTVTAGGGIPITPCALYWITGKRDPANANCSFSLYDAATGALVGESTTTMGTTNVTWNIKLGNTTTDLSTSGNTYWDDFVVNYTTGFYPLGPGKSIPPAPPPPPIQLGLLAEDGTGILGQSGESILLQ